MRKFLSVSLLAAAVSLSGSNAFAVVQTPVDVAGIVAQCETAAASTGQCLAVVRAYLAQLKALPAASRDQAITNLVLALAPLGQSRAANAAFRRELAQAVREVAKLASTPQ